MTEYNINQKVYTFVDSILKKVAIAKIFVINFVSKMSDGYTYISIVDVTK